MDKRDRADIFRKRLSDAMDVSGLSRSHLARLTHVDRSTIGQLLNKTSPRLPNGQLVADLAATLSVSIDWLLGLTNRPESPGDIIAGAMALSPAERTVADAQLLDWHQEATGYKIRHVPATLPDILKTERVLNWEYPSFENQNSTQMVDSIHPQLNWLQTRQSDYEIAIPLHELEACARGISYYADLDEDIRREQLQFIAQTCRDMFPRLRLFLFNARRVFSAPITIFGPKLAVIYVGQCYLAFREADRVNSLTDHFDWLVREAEIDARHVAEHIENLID
ncbi:helix-turn-helix domain-containing protein [Cohaesibacter gelatinilyticus]|uniref:Helix-turn-helix n=1 Tax=Cohaesibacter gelatinilyticus TaxID=372072 RepID=A0A285PJK3_9HYPH|nr:helix-turn-helix transcriptional regulator [Cohaesibacter gelatinilyticus]SNZ20296.1 Helix-turn-helix [Cohaesibacter gelatinilyticus]